MLSTQIQIHKYNKLIVRFKTDKIQTVYFETHFNQTKVKFLQS